MKRIKKFSNIEVIFLVIVSSIIGLVIGNSININKNSKAYDKELSEFISTYNKIKEKYYKKINEEDILNGAINGMLSELDKHSMLIDREENENFYLTLDGSYNGIGIEIAKIDGKITIIGVIPNSPASEVGLTKGDIVKKIDDIDLEDEDTKKLSNYVRKESTKKEFNVVVDRNGEELTFNIKKQNVIITSVLSKIFERNDKKIGYIYISIFSNTTAYQFNKELEKLEKSNIDALIIDVRENTGGHLTTAVNILSQLLSKDKILYRIEKQGKVTKHYSMGSKNIKCPVAIIQNGNSASASELVSISLKENLNATVIGETTYGKGTVQEYDYLSNGNMYKYTTKKWLSPKGNSIDEVGVKPDVEVSLSDEYYNDPSDDTDNQLNTAIDTVVSKIK